MKLRTDKWRHYLVAFTALVVVATGLAATPLRKSLIPFVTRPLGSWSLPVARSTGLATVPTAYRPASASVTTGSIVELSGAASAPADFTLARNGSTGLIDLGDVAEHSQHNAGASSGDGGSNKKGGDSNGGSSRFGNSFRWGRSGGFGSASGSVFSGSGSINRGSTGSKSGSGGGSGNGSAGSGGINDPGPIFNDHKSGFPELTGRKTGAVGAGGLAVGAATLASNPEPSTLILFGTGLITAVGTIRRRLRRQ
jgi:hypothetical protein